MNLKSVTLHKSGKDYSVLPRLKTLLSEDWAKQQFDKAAEEATKHTQTEFIVTVDISECEGRISLHEQGNANHALFTLWHTEDKHMLLSLCKWDTLMDITEFQKKLRVHPTTANVLWNRMLMAVLPAVKKAGYETITLRNKGTVEENWAHDKGFTRETTVIPLVQSKAPLQMQVQNISVVDAHTGRRVI